MQMVATILLLLAMTGAGGLALRWWARRRGVSLRSRLRALRTELHTEAADPREALLELIAAPSAPALLPEANPEATAPVPEGSATGAADGEPPSTPRQDTTTANETANAPYPAASNPSAPVAMATHSIVPDPPVPMPAAPNQEECSMTIPASHPESIAPEVRTPGRATPSPMGAYTIPGHDEICDFLADDAEEEEVVEVDPAAWAARVWDHPAVKESLAAEELEQWELDDLLIAIDAPEESRPGSLAPFASMLMREADRSLLAAIAHGLERDEGRLAYLNLLRTRATRRLALRELTDALLLLLAHPDDLVAGRAARLLGFCQDWSVNDRMVALAYQTGRDPFRRRVVKVLLQVNGERTDALVARGLEARAPAERLRALRALRFLPGKSTVERLRAVVETEADPRVRRYAARCLVEAGAAESEKDLAGLLSVPDEAIQRLAIQGIGERKTAGALEELRALAEGGGPVGEAAIEALCRIGTSTAVRALGEILAAESSRDMTLTAIERFQLTACAPALAELLENPVVAEGWKLAAMNVLATLDTTKAASTLLHCLDKGSRALRRHAIGLVGRTGQTRAITRLGRILAGSPSTEMRVHALHALAGMEDDRARKALSQALGNSEPEVRRVAVHRLHLEAEAAAAAGEDDRADEAREELLGLLAVETAPDVYEALCHCMAAWPLAELRGDLVTVVAALEPDLEPVARAALTGLLDGVLRALGPDWAGLLPLLGARDAAWGAWLAERLGERLPFAAVLSLAETLQIDPALARVVATVRARPLEAGALLGSWPLEGVIAGITRLEAGAAEGARDGAGAGAGEWLDAVLTALPLERRAEVMDAVEANRAARLEEADAAHAA